MDPKVCVNCGNKKPVNGTSNRLVTESCGHVKCMQCLLQETSGCLACKSKEGNTICKNERDSDLGDGPDSEEVTTTEDDATLELPTLKENIENNHVKKSKLITSHIKIETDGDTKRYTCTICKKTYTSRSQTIYHAYCNGQKKPYQCSHPDCENKNKGFATLSHYKYHMQVHNGERQYKCDVCHQSFVLKSKLQRHKLKHTKDKKYQCHDCGRGFNDRSALRKHMRQHSGEAPYRCPRCARNFIDSSNFKKHLKRHDKGRISLKEPRPFKCPECPQSFHKANDLKRHSFVHSESKPFGCQQCTSAFRRKDNLTRHVRNSPGKHGAPTAGSNGTDGCENGTSNGAEPKMTNGLQATIKKNPDSLIHNKTLTPDEVCEKAKLEVLNPLPPLPEDVIKKHLYDKEKDVKIDKSYIIEANNARQSVITKVEPKNSNPVTEYVHKIRKANSLTCRKEIPLPPIDEAKFIELTTSSTNLDVGPLPKNIQMYKKILHDKSEKNGEGKVPEVHWRKKRLTDPE